MENNENVLDSFNSLLERMDKGGNFINEVKGSTTNSLPLVSINESNALRMLSRHTKDGYVIVSPCKGYDFYELDPNNPQDVEKKHYLDNRRIEKLISKIKESGFSYTPVYGGYREENEDGTSEDVYEHSFMIYPFDKNGNPVDFEALKAFALGACKEYDQDSVLVQEPENNPKYVTADGETDMEFDGKTKFNDMAEPYFTDLHNGGKGDKHSRFIFKEAYINPAPQSYSERHIRYLNGEVFINE